MYFATKTSSEFTSGRNETETKTKSKKNANPLANMQKAIATQAGVGLAFVPIALQNAIAEAPSTNRQGPAKKV
jgi:hypothetical protein